MRVRCLFSGIIALILAITPLCAQQGDLRFANYQKEIDPQLVPGSPTPAPGFAGTRTVYINEITLTNTTTSDVSCTIKDNQDTPMTLYDDTLFARGSGKSSHFVMAYKGRKMPGGITWSCSSGTAVVGYIQYATGRY